MSHHHENHDFVHKKKASSQLVPIVDDKQQIELNGKHYQKQWNKIEHSIIIFKSPSVSFIYSWFHDFRNNQLATFIIISFG